MHSNSKPTTSANPRLYSYIRFSDIKQKSGSSAERQRKYAIEWSEKNGIPLDTTLTMKDEGLSAFHQHHLTKGALGLFLEAINQGKIPEGSILMLEAWDRFSRATPLEALAVLKQIVDHNVSVVIARENKTYTKANLAETELMYAIIGLSVAHKESAQKSQRVKEAIAVLCEKWKQGTHKGPIHFGTDPSWVVWKETKFELIPERVEAIRLVIRLYKQGYGFTKILKALDEEGLRSCIGKGTLGSTTHLYRMILSPLLIGTKKIAVKYKDQNGVEHDEHFELEDYYPSVINKNEHEELKQHGIARKRTPSFPNGKTLHPSIMTGFGATFCGYCGAPAVTQNQVRHRYGKTEESRRIRCERYGQGDNCVPKCSSNMLPFEIAILNFCSDQFNLSSLSADTGAIDKLETQLITIKSEIIAKETDIHKIVEASLRAGDQIADSYLKRAALLEKEIGTLKARQDDVNRELMTISREGIHNNASTWADIANRVLELDDEARMKCRKLVADTFKSIRVFFQGFPYRSKSDFAILVLTGHNGTTRHLRIDKRTGVWSGGFDVNST